LQVMYRKPDIVTTIKLTKPELAGHLVRMSDEKAAKKVFPGKTEGRRKAARPKLRWFDCIERDLKSMSVKRWRNKSEDRYAWDVIQKRHSLNYKDLIPVKNRSTFFPLVRISCRYYFISNNITCNNMMSQKSNALVVYN